MKNLILLSTVMSFLFCQMPLSAIAASSGAPVPHTQVEETHVSKKQLKKQKRSKRIAKFVKNRIEKIQKKAGKKGFSDLEKNLQLCLLFLAGAVLFGILSSFVPALWILSSLAALGSAIFFILWLIEYLE